MGRHPVDRVLDHNMRLMEAQTNMRPHDPIFNPHPATSPPPIVRFDPHQDFNGKDFGRPATGDGEMK